MCPPEGRSSRGPLRGIRLGLSLSAAAHSRGGPEEKRRYDEAQRGGSSVHARFLGKGGRSAPVGRKSVAHIIQGPADRRGRRRVFGPASRNRLQTPEEPSQIAESVRRFAPLAQLDRASASGAEGQRFESSVARQPHHRLGFFGSRRNGRAGDLGIGPVAVVQKDPFPSSVSTSCNL